MNILPVIEQRMKLQSTQRELDLLGVSVRISNGQILLNGFSKLSEDKKNKLISTLGGNVNFWRTKKFLNI